VAACYRCLMSYYNQPDHELIDRREEGARALLLRLARATTSMRETSVTRPAALAGDPTTGVSPALVNWLELAGARDLPRPDPTPFVNGESQIQLVWRAHYVAVVFEDTAESIVSALKDKGFEFVVFAREESSWPQAFTLLSKALGRTDGAGAGL